MSRTPTAAPRTAGRIFGTDWSIANVARLLRSNAGRGVWRQAATTGGSSGSVNQYYLRTGSKNPTHSCPGDRWKWSAFYAIAEFLEFPHHACGARAFGLGTHRWPPFLVA